MGIQRWSVWRSTNDEESPQECSDGRWVDYEDHAAALAAKDAEIRKLTRVGFIALETLEDMEASGVIPDPTYDMHDNGWFLSLNQLREVMQKHRIEIKHGNPKPCTGEE